MKPSTFLHAVACCLFALLSANPLQAQTETESSYYRREIGLDFSMPLHGYRGASLVYKNRISAPKVNKRWQKTRAIRALAGAYRYDNTAQTEYFLIDSAVTQNLDGRNSGAFIHAGWELQYTRKKIRLYFGGDLGFEYVRANSRSRYEVKENGIALPPYETKTVSTRNIPGVSAFGGVNYFLTRRLNLGFEINVPISIDIETARTTSQNTDTRYENTILEVGGDYLPRLIYLSLHFGKDKDR